MINYFPFSGNFKPLPGREEREGGKVKRGNVISSISVKPTELQNRKIKMVRLLYSCEKLMILRNVARTTKHKVNTGT